VGHKLFLYKCLSYSQTDFANARKNIDTNIFQLYGKKKRVSNIGIAN
jgi:hypothetical protein